MKKIILFSLLFALTLSAQVKVSIPNTTAAKNTTTIIPVKCDEIKDIAAITLFIKYDKEVVEFLEIVNNPFEGNFTVFDNKGIIGISWFNTTSVTVTKKLFDLKFKCKTGTSVLEFVKTKEIINKSGAAIEANFINGKITIKDKMIKVDSPNGGEEWKTGTEQEIKWTDDFDENVVIELLKDGKIVKFISSSTESDGSFKYKVEGDLEASSKYKVKIYSTEDKTISDESDDFFSIKLSNKPPAFVNLPAEISFPADTTKEFNIWEYVKDEDNEVKTLEYKFTPSNDTLVVNYDNTNGNVKLSVTNDKFKGSVDLKIVVKDSVAEISATIKVKVEKGSAIDPFNHTPTSYRLFQNYPNPFNPSTSISFTLPERANVKIEIYSALGKKIETVLDEVRGMGTHEVIFNSTGLPSGVYLYKIETNNFSEVRKMVLMK